MAKNVKNQAVGGKDAKVFKSFKDLSTQGAIKFRPAPTIEISVPEIRVETVERGMSALQAAAARLRAKKDAVRAKETVERAAVAGFLAKVAGFITWMKEVALPFIVGVQTFVDDPEYGLEYLDEPFEGEAGDEGKTMGQKRDEYQDAIDKYWNSEDLRVKLPVRATEAIYWLSARKYDRDGLIDAVDKMVENGVIVKNPNGDIPFFFQRKYAVAPEFDSLDEQVQSELKAEIRAVIGAQKRRIQEEYEQLKTAKAAEFVARSEITPAELLNPTKSGLCAVMVADGAMLVRAEGDEIEVLDAIGRPENGFSELRELETEYSQLRLKIVISRSSLSVKSGGLAPLTEVPKFGDIPGVPAKEQWKTKASRKFVWYAVREGVETFCKNNPRSFKLAVEPINEDPEVQVDAEQFHHKNWLGWYVVVLTKWMWKFPGPDGVYGEEEQVDNLSLTFQRFRDEKKRIRLRLMDFSSEHEEFLDKVGCLSPDGYLDNPRLPFFNNVLKADHAINFPKPGVKPTQKPAEPKDPPAEKPAEPEKAKKPVKVTKTKTVKAKKPVKVTKTKTVKAKKPVKAKSAD